MKVRLICISAAVGRDGWRRHKCGQPKDGHGEPPAVANGKVYAGGRFAMSVFGLTTFVSPPAITPNGGAYANATTVTLLDVTSGLTGIYYTLDGTVPGTNSLVQDRL